MKILALLAVLASPASAAAGAPLSPVSASCTTSLINAMTADVNERGEKMKDLIARIRSEKKLLVADARAVFTGPAPIPAPEGLDVFACAERLEALRPKLSDQDWTRGAGLWADWLARAERDAERAEAADYCGLRAEGRSFAQDAHLMVFPFTRAAKGDDSLMPSFHLAAAAGLMGLGLDAVTFLPNVAMSGGRRVSRGLGARKTGRALKRFTDFVEASEAGAAAPKAAK
jgi:hypothetical protein